MANKHPNTKGIVPWPKGTSGNPKGKRKGTKSLALIVRELEDEEFDWDVIPHTGKKFKEALETMGSPWRAIVMKAVTDAVLKGDSAAREWLRKSGYGDKLDITSGNRPINAPIVAAIIKPREKDANTETETTDSN